MHSQELREAVREVKEGEREGKNRFMHVRCYACQDFGLIARYCPKKQQGMNMVNAPHGEGAEVANSPGK